LKKLENLLKTVGLSIDGDRIVNKAGEKLPCVFLDQKRVECDASFYGHLTYLKTSTKTPLGNVIIIQRWSGAGSERYNIEAELISYEEIQEGLEKLKKLSAEIETIKTKYGLI